MGGTICLQTTSIAIMEDTPSGLTLAVYLEAKARAIAHGAYPSYRDVQDIPDAEKPAWAWGLVERQHVTLEEGGDVAGRWVHEGTHLRPAQVDATRFLVVISPERLRAVGQFRTQLQKDTGQAYIAIPLDDDGAPLSGSESWLSVEHKPWLHADLGIAEEDYVPDPHQPNHLWIITWVARHVAVIIASRANINNMYIGIMPKAGMEVRFEIHDESYHYYPSVLAPVEEDYTDLEEWYEDLTAAIAEYWLPPPLAKGYNGRYHGIPGTFVYYKDHYAVRPLIDPLETVRVTDGPHGWLRYTQEYNESWSVFILFEYARTEIMKVVRRAEGAIVD